MNIHATMTSSEFAREASLPVHQRNRSLVDKHGRSRVGRYMHTAGGEKWWPFDPRADEVNIRTIAHHLAGQGRWQGAVQHRTFLSKIFYSVAEHSVWCSFFVPEELALEALLHDASEAYIGDLIRPLKYDDSFRAPFKLVEDEHERVIAERFGLRWNGAWPAEVKKADELVCAAESDQIVVRDPSEDWESGKLHDDSQSADIQIQMLEPFHARELFLTRFHELYDLTRGVRR